MEPGTRIGPVALRGRRRDAEQAGRFLAGAAAVEAQLDQFRLDGIFFGQSAQGIIEGEKFVVRFGAPPAGRCRDQRA